MPKVNPVTQRMFSEGTRTERESQRQESSKKLQDFQSTWRGRSVQDREQALIHLMEAVSNGKEDIDFLRLVLKSGSWLMELEGCMKRTRWILSLNLPDEFKGRR